MSLQRYFITLSYDGTRYHGWQIQPNGISVEECLRDALTTLLRKPVETVGAGRTDAGVHARKMVVHFDDELSEENPPAPGLTDGQTIDCQQLVYRLNRLLPHDIAVQGVEPVASNMHARFSAVSRTYHYYIHTRKDPFLNPVSSLIHRLLRSHSTILPHDQSHFRDSVHPEQIPLYPQCRNSVLRRCC